MSMRMLIAERNGNRDITSARNLTPMLIAVILAIVSGVVVAFGGPVWGGLISALIVFAVIIFARPAILLGLWLISSVSYRYLFDVGPISLNPYRILFLLVVLIIPFLIIRRQHGDVRPFSGLSRKILQVTLFSALVIMFGVGWLRSPQLYQDLAKSELLLKTSWIAMVLYLVLYVSNPRQLQTLEKCFLITSSILATFGVYQGVLWGITGDIPSLPFSQYAFRSWSFVGSLGIPRIEGLLHDPNLQALYLVVAVLIILAKLEAPSSEIFKSILIVLLLVHVIAIFFTVSRGGILILFFSVGAFYLKIGKIGVSRFALIALVVALIVLIGLFLSRGTISSYFDSYFLRFSSGDSDSIRRNFLQAGAQAFLSSPIIGIGMGNPTLVNTSRLDPADTAHSFYLSILAKYGLVGGVLMLLFLWPFLSKIWRTLTSRRTTVNDVAFALGAGSILIYQFVYDILMNEILVLPFAIFYLWALGYHRSNVQNHNANHLLKRH